MIAFIHIGKTGGTTIHHLLRNKLKNYSEYHLRNTYKSNEKYIIWIRNPINRFVSAFNHSFYGIHTDVQSIKEFDLEHCLIPTWMKNARGKPYVFSQKYDTLFKQFTSANHLAESLTSEDKMLQRSAVELMNRPEEHIDKGIAWYLKKHNFLSKNRNNILFIGRTETMKDDIIKLSNILGVKLDENLRIRENVYVDSSMKYLSPLAIRNIINWYKDTDYAILQQLLTDKWIDEATFNSYHTYEY